MWKEAKLPVLTHIQYLMDTKSGLWFPRLDLRRQTTTSPRHYGARGNSSDHYRCDSGIYRSYMDLAENDPIRRFLLSVRWNVISDGTEASCKLRWLWHYPVG